MTATVATVATFREQFPEYAEVADHPDDAIQRMLDVAKTIHAIRPLATLYCTAHFYKIEEMRQAGISASGELLSERAGPMSVNYVTQAETSGFGVGSRQAFFTRTEYGRQFLILEHRSPRHAIGAVVV